MKTAACEAEACPCITYSELRECVSKGLGRNVSPSTLSRWMEALEFPDYDPKKPRQHTTQDAIHLVIYGQCLKEAAQKGRRELGQRALALFLERTEINS